MADQKKKENATESPKDAITPKGLEASAPLMPISGGGVLADAMPTGLSTATQALEADITTKLAELGPAFGDVLTSIGMGVASSQAALDKGMVDAAKKLSETKVKVITEVVQVLNDNGLPDLGKTKLISNDVALINYIAPTVEEWNNVALSMDFSVGAMDSERGLSFNRTQTRTSVGGGAIWGFLGWFNVESSTSYQSYNQQTNYEANWAQGQVRLDASMAPRRSQNFPVPARVNIGPQLFFTLGSLKQTEASGGSVPTRSLDVVIKVLKANGAVNASVPVIVESPFRMSFATDGGFTGSMTNADGEVKVTFTRDLTAGFGGARGQVTARLGQISKSMQITL